MTNNEVRTIRVAAIDVSKDGMTIFIPHGVESADAVEIAGTEERRDDVVRVIDALRERVAALEARVLPAGMYDDKRKRVGLDPIYTTDEYPREGCKVVIEFKGDKYHMTVYPPGAVPNHMPGWLESYAPRKLAALGIALDAFAHGRTIRSVLPEMARAEAGAASDQVSNVVSKVTE